MQLLILALIVLFLYLAVRLISTAGAWLSGNRFRAYRLLASRYHGKYESRGLSESPTVSFAYNGSNVRVGLAPQIAGQPNNPRTRVVTRFRQGLPFRFELAPASRPAPPQAPKGTRPIRIGDQEFDRGYVIQANDPEIAAEFLSPTVRWSVGNLQRMAPPSGMLISVNPERMLVQVDRNLAIHPESLLHAVQEALMIHDGLVRAVFERLGQGVSIVAVGPASDDSGPPICKVCGEPIVAPGVLCAACRTPHHRDCWEFVGACSIYGCNGKHSIPA